MIYLILTNYGVLFMSTVNLFFSLIRWNWKFFAVSIIGFGLSALMFQLQGDSKILLLKLALSVGYALASLHFTKELLDKFLPKQ